MNQSNTRKRQRRRQLRIHPIVNHISRARLFGWWVRSYFEGFEGKYPITQVYFFTKWGAERFAAKN